MKRKNGKRIVLLSCLLLVVGVLFLLTSCGECTDHTFGDWETVKAPPVRTRERDSTPVKRAE